MRDWTTAEARLLLVEPPNKRIPLVTGDFDKNDSRVSPDGRWLAVCANPAGTHALYVRPIAERGTLQRMAAANPSCDVRWSAGTRELAFQRGSTLVALAYDERDGRLTPRETVIATLPRGSTLFGDARRRGFSSAFRHLRQFRSLHSGHRRRHRGAVTGFDDRKITRPRDLQI